MEYIINGFKTGYRTTEFWKSVIALTLPVAAFVASMLGYNLDTAQLSIALGGMVPAVVYILSRAWLKSNRVKSLAVSSDIANEAYQEGINDGVTHAVEAHDAPAVGS